MTRDDKTRRFEPGKPNERSGDRREGQGGAGETDFPTTELLAEATELEASAPEKARFAPWRPPSAGEGDSAEPAPAPRTLPEMVGPYRVLSLLGEGGMGAVYLAEQRKPVRRFVAVKVIRAGLTGPTSFARFMAERRALARLSHPAIAQMYEAATTEDGFPYFVMENVPGDPLVRYCDRRRLTLEERLRLFVQICRGVEHAHRKGILHRDLKPNNILVTDNDGEPQPKIIDFGIAKVMDPAEGEETLLTRFGIGTPAYMSPESFEVDPQLGTDVDTRSDVYALGVVLYELLVGSPPFKVKGSSLAEIMRVIAEDTPATLGRRYSSHDEKTQIALAESRGIEPSEMRKQLGGDLGWIVGKAMEKQRQRRYGSASDLADDVERRLRLEPVIAMPPSLGYRTGRFVRRHRGPVAGAALAMLAIVAGLIGTSSATVRADRQAQRANAEAAKTRAVLAEVQQVSNFLVDLFEVPDSESPGGESITARQILDRGAARIDDLSGQPLRRARLMHTIGTIYNQLQAPQVAQGLVSEALELRRQELDPTHQDIGESLYRLAVIHRAMADYEAAEQMGRKALELRGRQFEPDHPKIGEVERELGVALYLAGRHEDAEPHMRRALEIAQSHPEREPRAAALEALGNLLSSRGRCAEAIPIYEGVLTLRKRQLEELDPRLAYSLNNLASCLGLEKRYEESKEMMERALAIQEKALGPRAGTVIAGRTNLGILYRKLGQTAKAESALTEARQAFAEVLGAEHPMTANAGAELGVLYWQMERFEKAETELSFALGVWGAKLGAEHLMTAWAHANLANVLRDRGRLDEAEGHYVKAVDVRRAQLPPEHEDLRQALMDYAELLRLMNEGGRDRTQDLERLQAELSPSNNP